MASRSDVKSLIDSIVNTYGTNLASDGHNWFCFCPAHPDKADGGNASLRLYIKQDGRKTGSDEWELGLACNKGCVPDHIKHDMLSKGLIKDTGSFSRRPVDMTEVNYPPHGEPDWSAIPNYVAHWANRDLDGKIRFWHVRLKGGNGTSKKSFSRVFSVRDRATGVNSFEWRNRETRSTPYNAFALKHHPDKTVVIVEGPKTMDAGQELFGSLGYIFIAGESAASIETAFDWECCKERDVILWPDNDAIGFLAMQKLGNVLVSLGAKSVSITHTEALPSYPEGWDIADFIEPVPKDMRIPAGAVEPFDVLKGAVPFKPTVTGASVATDSALQAVFDKCDERFAYVVNSAGEVEFYDLQSPLVDGGYQKLLPETLKYFMPERDLTSKRGGYVVDLWVEKRLPKKIYKGPTYLPGIEVVTDIIDERGNLKLNVFTGYDVTPDFENYLTAGNIYKEYLTRLFDAPDAVEVFLDYVADMFQAPHRKPAWFVILMGPQGTGKSNAIMPIRKMLGSSNSAVLYGGELGSNFNSLYASKLFLDIEEVPSRDFNRLVTKLRHVVTTSTMNLNRKFSAEQQIPSHHRVMMTMNPTAETDAAIAGEERRPYVVRCNGLTLKRDGFNQIIEEKYFKEHAELFQTKRFLSGLLGFFLKRKVTTDMFKAPVSEAKKLALESRFENVVVQFAYELLCDAELPDDLYGQGVQFTWNNSKHTDWPDRQVLIPTGYFKRYILSHLTSQQRDANITEANIGKELSKLLPPRPRAKKKFNKIDRSGALSSSTLNAYMFTSIHDMRAHFAKAVGRPDMPWPIYEEAEAPDNLVPFKPPLSQDGEPEKNPPPSGSGLSPQGGTDVI